MNFKPLCTHKYYSGDNLRLNENFSNNVSGRSNLNVPKGIGPNRRKSFGDFSGLLLSRDIRLLNRVKSSMLEYIGGGTDVSKIHIFYNGEWHPRRKLF